VGLIYVDACLLIYAFEAHPVHGSAVRARLAHAAGQLAISPLVHLECLVGPMKTGNLVLRRYYEEGLQQLVNLSLPHAVFVQAAELRARHGLKTPDALLLAARAVPPLQQPVDERRPADDRSTWTGCEHIGGDLKRAPMHRAAHARA
jgi:predicted nucleic acid-binding protein